MVRNILGFLVKFGLFAGSFAAAAMLSNPILVVLCTLVSGVFLFSLGTVGHDCGHGAYLRPMWLNELVGQLSMVPHGFPYAGWKHSHNSHHANTNREEHDPDRLWLYRDEYESFNGVQRWFWKLFHTRLFWLSAVGHYFRHMLPWSFRARRYTRNSKIIRECVRDNFIFVSFMLGFHGTMWALGFGFKVMAIHAVVIVIALACLSVYVRTQHHMLPNHELAHLKPWETCRTVTQPKFMDFLATNLNYHVEHHVLQVVPHANLPDLRPLIKQALYNLGLPYHEQDMLEYLKMFRREDFHVLERGTMRELSAS